MNCPFIYAFTWKRRRSTSGGRAGACRREKYREFTRFACCSDPVSQVSDHQRRKMELRERRPGGSDTVSLKDKLKLHYETRDFRFDKKNAFKSTTGIKFFWFMTISLFIESQTILIPHLYGGDWLKVGLCFLLVWFTLFEAVINWSGVYFGMVNHADVALKEKHFPNHPDTPPQWKYCAMCQVSICFSIHNVPYRLR